MRMHGRVNISLTVQQQQRTQAYAVCSALPGLLPLLG